MRDVDSYEITDADLQDLQKLSVSNPIDESGGTQLPDLSAPRPSGYVDRWISEGNRRQARGQKPTIVGQLAVWCLLAGMLLFAVLCLYLAFKSGSDAVDRLR